MAPSAPEKEVFNLTLKLISPDWFAVKVFKFGSVELSQVMVLALLSKNPVDCTLDGSYMTPFKVAVNVIPEISELVLFLKSIL